MSPKPQSEPSSLPHRLGARRVVLRGALGALAAPWVARGAAPVRLRFAHVVAEDTPKGQMARRLQTLLAQRSGGRVRMEVYPESTLYGDADEIEAAQLGAVELLAPSLSKFGRLGLPEFELFDLPFLFPDREAVRRVMQGAVGSELLRRLQSQGLVGLGFLDNGFKHMSARRPLREPRDFTGLRLRVQPSRTIAAQMRALGAHPVVLDFGETRLALQRGVVDGTENPLSNFWTQRLHEVQTDLTLTAHGYLGYAVVAGARFWHHLDAADRALVQECLAEALAHGNALAQQLEAQALTGLRAAAGLRVHALTPAQRQALAAATAVVYRLFAQRVPGEWIERARAAWRG